MRLSELTAAVDLYLDNVAHNKWTPTQIGAEINRQHLALVRELANRDQAYINHRFTVSSSAARQLSRTDWNYRLPSWVMKVRSVREYKGPTEARGDVIPRRQKHQPHSGWILTAHNELELSSRSAALDLEIEVAKLPAKLTMGTLPDQAAAATNQLITDASTSADALVYPHESVPDIYAGSLIEITGPASARVGQILRVTGSATLGADPLKQLLTMEEDWTSQPVTSDTYEMHAQIAGEHHRILVLLATKTFLQTTKNVQAIEALRADLAAEYRLFLESIESRTIAGPDFVVDSLPSPDREVFVNPFYEDTL